MTKNIICRYGVPYKIITDNGTQFESTHFQNFCNQYDITKSFSAVAHPQANGQVEAVNKIIQSILKKKLRKAKGNWIDELPLAFWTYRITHKTATGHSPFALAYGTEAMIPVEAQIPTHRRENYDPKTNEELLNASLDLVDERRDEAQLRVADYQQRIARQCNQKVRNLRFEVGDLVLKRVFPLPDALAPNWEGPYAIKEKLGDGTFKLITVEGAPIPRAWNSEHLRRYLT